MLTAGFFTHLSDGPCRKIGRQSAMRIGRGGGGDCGGGGCAGCGRSRPAHIQQNGRLRSIFSASKSGKNNQTQREDFFHCSLASSPIALRKLF